MRRVLSRLIIVAAVLSLLSAVDALRADDGVGRSGDELNFVPNGQPPRWYVEDRAALALKYAASAMPQETGLLSAIVGTPEFVATGDGYFTYKFNTSSLVCAVNIPSQESVQQAQSRLDAATKLKDQEDMIRSDAILEQGKQYTAAIENCKAQAAEQEKKIAKQKKSSENGNANGSGNDPGSDSDSLESPYDLQQKCIRNAGANVFKGSIMMGTPVPISTGFPGGMGLGGGIYGGMMPAQAEEDPSVDAQKKKSLNFTQSGIPLPKVTLCKNLGSVSRSKDPAPQAAIPVSDAGSQPVPQASGTGYSGGVDF